MTTRGGVEWRLNPREALDAWQRLSLAGRFAILALLLSIFTTLFLGLWVARKIEQTARVRAAGAAAVYMAHFVSPELQDLEHSDTLSQEHIDRLDTIVSEAPMRQRIVAMKVWSRDGRVLYATNKDAIGEAHPITGALQRALNGEIASEFDKVDEEGRAEAEQADVLIEVYAPVHSDETGAIIAVSEVYEDADWLTEEIRAAMLQSWAFTGTALLLVFGAFSTMILNGSRTIVYQRNELTARISDLLVSVRKTAELRREIKTSARKVIEDNAAFLRSLGSELHDGPAQLIGIAQLRLDLVEGQETNPEVEAVRDALAEAMREIREISAGLLLPNLETQDIVESVKATVAAHEGLTGTDVAVEIGVLDSDYPKYVKICVCRVIQEGLMNAFRHANASDQRVHVEARGQGVCVQVSDTGPGFTTKNKKKASRSETRLGLAGLRSRIESVGGTLTIESKQNEGTRLIALVPIGGS